MTTTSEPAAASIAKSTSPSLVSIRSVAKHFGKNIVLRDISLEIAEGEFLTILGESGSGKTTLLRILAGFEQSTSGEVWMSGQRLDTQPPYRRRVNTVFQSYALFPHMTVEQNVGYGLAIAKRPTSEIETRVSDALAKVKMSAFAKSKPSKISGGQQQRIALARALVNRPQLLLLDEPLSALDANLRRQMQVELKALQREVGITFIFVTHDQEEAMVMSDRIALLRSGELEQVASPREIYNRPATSYTAQFIGHTNLLHAEVRHGIAKCGALQWPTSLPDGVALFSLRPESIRPVLSGSQVDNATVRFRAALRDQAFHGATDLLRVEAEGAFVLTIRTASRDLNVVPLDFEFSPGDAVPIRPLQGKNLVFSRAYRIAITVPPLLWVTVFLLVPYLLMFCYSFWAVSESQAIVHAWTFDNYKELLTKPVYWETLLRSMWIAVRVTFFSMLLGYPLAYFLSFHAGKKKDLYYQLVIIPLWVSYLVRAYAWKTILGTGGVLNTMLQYAHLTSHPLDFLLYSPFAVVLTLTHIYTPFTFLPIYASLEHIPRNLVEASHDLGATPAQTFWRVIFPLSIPGMLAGATFAFVLSLGDFLAPLLLGGPSGIMISNIVVSLFGAAYNWPLGATISLCMLALVLGLIFFSERLEKKWSF